MWIKRAVIAAALVGVFAILAPLVSSSLVSEEEEEFITHSIQRGDLAITVTENGTLESSNNEEIKCFVKGGSTVLWVIETGTFVKPGDVLVRLDDSVIEENITQQTIQVERAIANKIIADGEVEVAETNIEEYENGTYQEEKNTIEKEIFDATERVKKAQLTYESAIRMASKGMFRSLQLEGEKFAVDSALKDLELKNQQLQTLNLYKRKKTIASLKSALDAAKARLAAEEASLSLEQDRLERDKEQLVNCEIKAESSGMVIFPSAAEWKETPDIEEGAVVREQQTLLMIPDLDDMQVKVGIHESKVDRLTPGMPAQIQLQDRILNGTVDSIAEVTRPAGWWTGNMVKYDTIIKIEKDQGLKPGMSAVVDVVLAEYTDVLKIPVAAIVQNEDEMLCWVRTDKGIQRRAIEIGGSNDEFTVVKAGLAEGDDVVLNPLAYIDEAQREALKPAGPSLSEQTNRSEEKAAAKKNNPAKEGESDTKDAESKKPAGQSNGAKVIAMADKNKDGVLTVEELEEKDRPNFGKVDTNGDGKIDVAEMDAMLSAVAGGQ